MIFLTLLAHVVLSSLLTDGRVSADLTERIVSRASSDVSPGFIRQDCSRRAKTEQHSSAREFNCKSIVLLAVATVLQLWSPGTCT